MSRPEVSSLLTEKELDAVLDPNRYIGTAVEQVDEVIADFCGEHIENGGQG